MTLMSELRLSHSKKEDPGHRFHRPGSSYKRHQSGGKYIGIDHREEGNHAGGNFRFDTVTSFLRL